MITVSLFIAVALCVLEIVAYWKIFTKAGESGWKCLIPFYNLYVQYKFSWKAYMAVIVIILAVLDIATVTAGVISGIGTLATVNTGSSISATVHLYDGVASMIYFVLLVAIFVIQCIAYNKLAKSFGHGAGFTVGLIFLRTIFIMILGFGSSQYVGNTCYTSDDYPTYIE